MTPEHGLLSYNRCPPQAARALLWCGICGLNLTTATSPLFLYVQPQTNALQMSDQRKFPSPPPPPHPGASVRSLPPLETPQYVRLHSRTTWVSNR